MLGNGNAIEKTAHRKMYPLPQSNLVLQSPMAPGQFDMLKNAHVLRSDIPPANQIKCYRAQLHQVSITYCRIPTYPGQTYPPANQTGCYRARLHQVSITYCRMPTYPRQMYPPNKSSSTEPYDTRSVWYVTECQHT